MRPSLWLWLLVGSGCRHLVDPWEECPHVAVPAPAPGDTPVVRAPYNGFATGSVWATSENLGVKPRRPSFRWDPVPGATSYEIQLDDSCAFPGFVDCTFPSPELSFSTAEAELVPAEDLPVAIEPPVGTRYTWRVRSCEGAACSPWSRPRYLDVGRSRKDLNGDGYADVAVAGPLGEFSGTDPLEHGFVAVYSGSPTGLEPTPSGLLGAGPEESGFGHNVSVVGDVNGDGFADLAVRATERGAFPSGVLLLYFGDSGGIAPEPAVRFGSGTPRTLGEFGESIAGSDLNGDGFANLVVGAPREGEHEEGRVWVRYGTPTGITNRHTLLEHPDNLLFGAFGNDLAANGDVDGDGFVNVVVGAPRGDPEDFESNFSPGLVTVHRGGPDGLSQCWSMRSEPNTSPVWSSIGESVSQGDFDGDGFSDLLVGSHGSMMRGITLVHAGGPDGPRDRWTSTIESPMDLEYQYFGTEVASVGDVDADGDDDALLGMIGFIVEVDGDQRRHWAFAYAGDPGGLGTEFVRQYPDEHGVIGMYGRVLAAAGDVDGDGYADALVRGTGETIEVFHGSPSGLPPVPNLVLTNPEEGFGVAYGWAAD